MNKILCNAFFTLVMVGLSALVIHWNREELPQDRQYIREESEALAANSPLQLGRVEQSAVSLKVSYSRPVLRLKQKQILKIETEPFAQLEIVTTYPNGSINNSQTRTASADEKGIFEMSFEFSDYNNLGNFSTKVTAYLGNSQSQSSALFVLARWGENPTPPQINHQYQYPLLP